MTTAEIIPSQEYTELATTAGQPLDQNPAAVYLASLGSAESRRTMRTALDKMAAILSGGRANCLSLNWAAVRYQHAAAIRARLAEQYAPKSANKMLAALRGTLKAAWLLGQMPAEDYYRAAAVKAVIGDTVPAGRELAAGELHALLAACAKDPTPAGARDAAIISIAYAAGLRRAELASLDLASYDTTAGRLTVHGKRNKTRYTYVENGAAEALADWLQLRGNEPGPLFYPVNKGGRIQPGRRITAQAIYNMLAKRAAEAGVTKFSPHDLRRTFVSDLLESGGDIASVAKLAGHNNVQTTARYDRRPEEAKRKTAQLLHVPHFARPTK